MKITNISSRKLYLQDLRILHASQTEGRRGEDSYLVSGAFVYVPNTSEVLRSAFKGDLKKWANNGTVTLEDLVILDALHGMHDTVILSHNFGFLPTVYVVKSVGSTWVDATGTVDISHNSTFTTTTVANTLGVSQTLTIKLA